jgi:ubiquinone/menaquinone biosynthesis C-methylase UbiE
MAAPQLKLQSSYINYMEESIDDQKQMAVQQFWNGKPCDSENSQLSPVSCAFYQEIEVERYTYQDHIPTILNNLDWKGKKVLEIGTGVGTDARKMISSGAEYYGINVDAGSCKLTRQALELFKAPGILEVMNATSVEFSDKTFDTVYTFGVLHHIPDVDKAISEIHRVLKPGGKLLFMVYNRSSINYQIEIRYLRRWILRLLQVPRVITLFSLLGFPRDKLVRHVDLFNSFGNMSESEWLSRNTDGPDSPYSIVYGKEEVERLLGDKFKLISNRVYYFESRHWGPFGRILPRFFVQFLGRKWGWHRVVLAECI